MSDAYAPAVTLDPAPDTFANAHSHLFARKQVPAEWWYYNGHLNSGEKRFSFHVAFFRYDCHGITIGRVVPLKMLGDKVAFAHCSITDHQTGQTYFSQRRAFKDHQASGNSLNVTIADWALRGDRNEHQAMIQGANFCLRMDLQPVKPMAIYGDGGLNYDDWNRKAVHCSFPRMQAKGELEIADQHHVVDGIAWMDREYGQVGPDQRVLGWNWISVQLDDRHDLMFYSMALRDGSGALRAAHIDPIGHLELLDSDNIEMTVNKSWTSPKTGSDYPTEWEIRVRDIDTRIHVKAEHHATEFDTRGSTSLFYMECPAVVSGSRGGTPLKGRGYMESVAAGKRHVGCFDQVRQNMSLLGYVTNEVRCRMPSRLDQIIQPGTKP